MPPSELQARRQAILDVPLNRHLGLNLEADPADDADGTTTHAWFDVMPEHLAFGGLHGGVLYALMDAVAMLALLPTLTATQHAVTHDLHASMMRAVAPGARCRLSAHVVRQGRTLAFIEAGVRVDGAVVASARVTKSITGAR